MTLTWRLAGVQVQTKSADDDFERLHPRGANGRFIRLGGRVRISALAGGGEGTVRGLGPQGTIDVERGDGRRQNIAKGYLTVLDGGPARPNLPTAPGQAAPAPRRRGGDIPGQLTLQLNDAADVAPPAAAAPAADWERWRNGRDVAIARVDRDAENRRQRFEATIAEREAEIAEIDQWHEQRLKELQEEHGLTPAAARKAIAREQTAVRKKENRDWNQGLLEKYRAELAGMPEPGPPLPEYNRDLPLQFYGNRLVLTDDSDITSSAASALERHLTDADHHLLRDHFTGTDDGGLYLGDRPVNELDDLEYLRDKKPRGLHNKDATYANSVLGVYSPNRRVTAVGRHSDDRDHAGHTALHEAGHAMDDALGRPSAKFGPKVYGPMLDELASAPRGYTANPYYTKAGNPDGWGSEGFAETLTAWRLGASKLPDAEAGAAILEQLGIRLPLGIGFDDKRRKQYIAKATAPLVAYMRQLDERIAQESKKGQA